MVAHIHEITRAREVKSLIPRGPVPSTGLPPQKEVVPVPDWQACIAIRHASSTDGQATRSTERIIAQQASAAVLSQKLENLADFD